MDRRDDYSKENNPMCIQACPWCDETGFDPLKSATLAKTKIRFFLIIIEELYLDKGETPGKTARTRWRDAISQLKILRVKGTSGSAAPATRPPD